MRVQQWCRQAQGRATPLQRAPRVGPSRGSLPLYVRSWGALQWLGACQRRPGLLLPRLDCLHGGAWLVRCALVGMCCTNGGQTMHNDINNCQHRHLIHARQQPLHVLSAPDKHILVWIMSDAED